MSDLGIPADLSTSFMFLFSVHYIVNTPLTYHNSNNFSTSVYFGIFAGAQSSSITARFSPMVADRILGSPLGEQTRF